ncbi:MAG: YcaO-like family protein [Halorhabdus sp.]
MTPVPFKNAVAPLRDSYENRYETVVLDSARSHDKVMRALGDTTPRDDGEPVLSIFGEGSRLFVLRSPVSDIDPCPHCVLRHLASDSELVSILDNGEMVAPSQSLLAALRDGSAYAALDTELSSSFSETDAPSATEVVVVTTKTGGKIADVSVAENVVKHPACRHDRLPEREPNRVTSLTEIAETFTDASFGLFRTVIDVARRYESTWFEQLEPFQIAQVYFLNPAFHSFPDKHKPMGEAGGPGFSDEQARLRSFMEGCERHATLLPAPGRLIGRETDFQRPVVTPTECYFYREEQYDHPGFSFSRYDPEAEYEWTACTTLDGNEVLVPADFVYPTPSGATSTKLIDGNSNGTAAHFATEEAVIGAVTELFERDATMRHWFTQTPQPTVRIETLPDRCRRWARTLSENGYRVTVADVTRHKPFRVFEVFLKATNPDSFPLVVPAAACALSSTVAVEKAFLEALDILVVADAIGGEPVADPQAVTTTQDHFLFHQRPDRREYARRLFDTHTERPFRASETESSLPKVRKALDTLDVDAFYRDVSPPYLSRRGISVVRAVSPDLVPITFGFGRQRLSHPSDPVPNNVPDDIPHMYP